MSQDKITLNEAMANGTFNEFAQTWPIDDPHPNGAARFEAVLSAMTGTSNNWSDMKSIAQNSFADMAGWRSSRSFADTFRFGVLFRNCRLSWQ